MIEKNFKGKAVTFAAVAVFVAALICGVLFGSAGLSFGRIIDAIRGDDKNAAIILFDLRLPRVVASLIAGAGLAVAGSLLQTITDNELCAPNIIGVNSGAGLFVMLMLCFFPMQWRYRPIAAFVGALAASFIVLGISRAKGRYNKKSMIILAGVAVSSLLGAGISFLSLRFPDVLSSYTAFSVGGFSGTSFDKLALPALMTSVGIICAYVLAPKISLLSLGDETAQSLGVRVSALRTTTVIISAVLCGAVVSFAGLLGFVGLIVPHIVKRLVCGTLRKRIPYLILFGASLTCFSDLIGRSVMAPGELPAGIIMAAIGAPFFIYLLKRHDRA